MNDTSAHRETAAAAETQRDQLSNAGMSVYEGLDQVVVLSRMHRLTQLSDATTDKQRVQRSVRAIR